MSAYWDWVASGGADDASSWGSDSDSYGDWGDPSTWVLPDADVFDQITGFISNYGGKALDLLSSAFKNPDGSTNWRGIAAAGGALLPFLESALGGGNRPASYQGEIPKYTAVREQVPGAYDPNRRPGSGGQRYLTDVQYVPKGGDLAAAQASAAEQAQGLASLNALNPARQEVPHEEREVRAMARGGIVGLQDGGFVVPADVVSHLGNGSTDAGLAHLARKGAVPIRGKGDGMSDSNRTTINGRQPAAVADGEAYLPPRQVQNMGGAEKLYAMMDKIRRDRTGSPKQGKQINPNQYV